MSCLPPSNIKDCKTGDVLSRYIQNDFPFIFEMGNFVFFKGYFLLYLDFPIYIRLKPCKVGNIFGYLF